MQFTERRREIYNHAYGKGADLRYRARENVRRHANDAAPAQKRPKWSFRPPAPGSQRQSVTGAASGLLTVMGGMAEFERKLVRARCEEGIRRALARLMPASVGGLLSAMLPARRWPWRASTKSARPRSGGLCGRAEPVVGARRPGCLVPLSTIYPQVAVGQVAVPAPGDLRPPSIGGDRGGWNGAGPPAQDNRASVLLIKPKHQPGGCVSSSWGAPGGERGRRRRPRITPPSSGKAGPVEQAGPHAFTPLFCPRGRSPPSPRA